MMGSVGQNFVIASYPRIDGKSTGNTLLFTTENGTQRFIPIMLRMEALSYSGVITAPTTSIGTNSPSFNNIFNPGLLSTLIPTVVNGMKGYDFGAGEVTSIAPNTEVFFRVGVAATATTYEFRTDIIGYYV